ncbi:MULTISPECIES: MobF family relaxase [unclassified Sphingomonas]|uniref:MobF family relaxase n=1 Tax=unclassified Sphingomonas TaxID=196159 RepID=UPI000929F231|nr:MULTISPECIES: MobF family relaxase [unclassified Sphingomonas]MBN8847356.1 conjugative relaxase [Sphingomonas sp.]OJV28235.1 MAG: AAA family ATPase [Sphingomonas sp. 67-36]
MLSVASVRSASGAASYFAKDDYYTGEQTSEASLWDGAGAASLGLDGEVDAKVFEGILNGVLPDGEAVGQVDNRQAGVDMTFSLPKSASVLAYVAGDQRILAANMTAVRATMRWVEANLAEGRKDVDGRKVPVKTGNLVYALFQHDTSRALDPQGHIHAVIANLTRMPDGQMRALHNGALWKNNAVIGSIYHAQLRHEFEKLGYRIEGAGKHGSFEIAGVPKPVIDAFSQRRQAILAKAAELGIVSPQGRDEITTNTRDPKLNVEDRTALRQAWVDKAAGLGFDGAALVAAAHAAAGQSAEATRLERGYAAISKALGAAAILLGSLHRPHDPLVDSGLARLARSPADARAQLAVASAVRILSEREAAFPLAGLSKAALDLALPGVTIDHVERRVATLLDRGQLLPEASRRHDGAVLLATTPEALRTEEQILAAIEEGRGRAAPIVPASAAPERLQDVAAQPLNPGQLAAATMIVGSADRTVVVQGVAGAGKSTMLGAVARVAEGEGRSVLGLAFQNKMVADLSDGAGIESRTVAAFVHAHERFLIERAGPRYEEARAALASTLLVVDETSMVSSADLLKLHQIVDALGVEKLALIGDRQQLSSIDAGKAFALVQAGGATTTRMDENIRQRSDQLRTVAALANVGRARAAIDVLGASVVENAAPAEHAAALWLALSPDERQSTQLFASGRDTRATLNRVIQDGLAAEGTVKGDGLALIVLERVNHTHEEMRHASSYHAGQVLEVGRRLDGLGLTTGRYDVTRVFANGRVELAIGGRRMRIDPQRLPLGGGQGGLGLSERKALRLHEGDRIRWTANDKPRGLHNSAIARVVSIDGRGVTVETAGRDRLILGHSDPMLGRLDLAYSLNMHMAQGITTDRAITVMSSGERYLSNQRLFNVGVTRVRDQLTLVVDDKERLQAQLDRTPGNKTSALETLGRLEIDARKGEGRGRFDPGPLSPDLIVGPKDRPAPRGGQARAAPARTDLPPLPLPERSLGLDL